MMRVADIVAAFFQEKGLKDLFLVTGGGAMHLNDAFGRSGLHLWPCHHEQTCAMAAESYFRLTGRMAAVNVTTGPGGTNALTGVWGAYVDSMAMFVISGQVKRETRIASTSLPLRQLGDQEVDIVPIVRKVTKYAVCITKPESILWHLDKAWHLALEGRPGPVWIDIPVDVQGARVEYSRMKRFRPRALLRKPLDLDPLLDALGQARRPVVYAGSGIRTSGQVQTFLEILTCLGIPVVTGFNAHDLLPSGHPCLCGRPGTIGDRPGNFTVQNADLLLVLGCRLNIRQISYNWKSFARCARVAMVDVDAAELKKPTLKVDLPLQAHLSDFLPAFRDRLEDWTRPVAHTEYLAWCRERVERYPVPRKEQSPSLRGINPYAFVEALTDLLEENAVLVTGNGMACIATFQAARIKACTRLYSNSGSAPMGFDLPAALGAAVTLEGRRVVCITGDGSLMMNLQELSTLALHRLPVLLFLFNNGGYHSIQQTQKAHFGGFEVGSSPASGVGFPDLTLLAQAHGWSYSCIEDSSQMQEGLARALSRTGPHFCEVRLDPEQSFEPRIISRRFEDGRMVSSPLEDMDPFLDREELRENLLIPEWEG